MVKIADGKVVIDVEVNKNNADKDVDGLKKSFDGLADKTKKSDNNTKQASIGIGKLATSLGIAQLATKVLSAGFNVVKQSVSSAIDRFDTLERFPKVMEQLGFDTNDSAKAMKKLSDGVQGLPTPLQDVVSTAQQLAVMTGDLEGATDITLALNNAFLANGSSTADAKRGLQQYTQMLARGEVDLTSWRTLQETMGLALNDVAKAFGFTGKAAQQDLFNALQNGTITFDEFNDKLVEANQKTGGFADKAIEASKGLKTSMANIKTAVVSGMANVIKALNDGMVKAGFDSFQEILEKVKVKVQEVFKNIVEEIPKAIAKIKEISDKFKEWEEFLQPIAGLVAGVVGALLTFATVTSVIKKVSDAIDLVKNSFNLMSLAMAANPIALAIGLIVGLGVALYVASRKSEKFREIVDNAFKKMKEDVEFVVNWIKDNVPKAFQKMADDVAFMEQLFRDIWQGIKDGAMYIWTNIRDSWNKDVQFLKDDFNDFVSFFSELWESIKKGASQLWTNVKESWNSDVEDLKSGWESFNGFFTDLWESIKTGSGNVWETTKESWNSDVEDLKNIWQAITNFFSELWESIKSLASSGWESITSTIYGIVEPFIDSINEAWTSILNGAMEIFEGIRQVAESAWELIKLAVLGPVLLLVDLVTGDFEGLREDMASIWESIKENIGLVWEGIVMIVSGYLEILTSALSLAWEIISTTAIEVWGTFSTGVTNMFNTMKDSVIETGITLKDEVIKQWNELSTGVTELAVTLKDEAVKQWNELKTGVKTASSELLEKAKSDWSELSSKVIESARTLKDSAVSDWDFLSTSVKGSASSLKTSASNDWNSLSATVKSASGTLRSKAVSDWNELSTNVKTLANSAKTGAISAWNTLSSETSRVFNAIKGFIEGPLKSINLRQVGKDIISGLIGGIESMWSGVKKAVGGLATTIKDTIRGALSIKSPSRWMRNEVGKRIPQGIALGIDADTKKAEDAMKKSAKSIQVASIQPEFALGIGGRMSTNLSAYSGLGGTETNNTNNDNGVTINIEKIENNTTGDIARQMEEIAWVLGRQGGRLERG